MTQLSQKKQLQLSQQEPNQLNLLLYLLVLDSFSTTTPFFFFFPSPKMESTTSINNNGGGSKTTVFGYGAAKTSVWWDIENCRVPKEGYNPNAIAQNISSALMKMGYCGPISISAYGDTNAIPDPVQHALSSTGISLYHIPAGIKLLTLFIIFLYSFFLYTLPCAVVKFFFLMEVGQLSYVYEILELDL